MASCALVTEADEQSGMRARSARLAVGRAGKFAATIPGRVRWWTTSEILRGLIAAFIGASMGSWLAEPFFTKSAEIPQMLGSVFGGWMGFAASHAIVTWVAFRTREGPGLRRALRVRNVSQPRRSWRWLIGTDGPMWAIAISISAIVAVALLLGFQSARGPNMLALVGILTLASWLDVMITFAASYARLDLGRDGPMLHFPDDARARTFSDYVYIALTVMSTFGLSDASACHPRMRRQVGTHAFIAFIFNTTIVAVLVSLIVTLAG